MSETGSGKRRRTRQAGTRGKASGARPAPDDELEWLRSCASRLWQRMLIDEQAGSDPKLMQALTQMVRAIAAIQHSRRQAHGRDTQPDQSLQEALRGLDPYEHL
jgi:hypothetical protein